MSIFKLESLNLQSSISFAIDLEKQESCHALLLVLGKSSILQSARNNLAFNKVGLCFKGLSLNLGPRKDPLCLLMMGSLSLTTLLLKTLIAHFY